MYRLLFSPRGNESNAKVSCLECKSLALLSFGLKGEDQQDVLGVIWGQSGVALGGSEGSYNTRGQPSILNKLVL